MQIKLANLMNGGLEERVEAALKQVVANILDPNTEETKAREIVINIKIVPWDNRTQCNLNTSVKTKLQPAKKLETIIMIGETKEGFEAAELGVNNPNQRTIDVDTGEIIDDKNYENVKKFNSAIKVVGQN